MKSQDIRLIPLVLFVAVLFGACGADGNSAETGISNDITGSVKEWEVTTSATTAKAGEVKFTITNDGTLGHEFLVVKTDIAPGKIPLDAAWLAANVDEDWQIETWGEDAEAAARRAGRLHEFSACVRFVNLAHNRP